MNDIENREDIVRMIDSFYGKVKTDERLAPVFSHLNWEEHLPIMYSFWSSMLLGEQSYQGNPFQKHKVLPIGTEHFERWLKLFTQTVDELFSGARAEEVKTRAHHIAKVFQFKMNLLK